MNKPELIEIEVPCEPCGASGEVTGLVLTGRHFYDPFEEISGTCRECFGRGYTRKEVCSICELEECNHFDSEMEAA
jgi:DnaJ-class molecular chaperone